MRKEQINGIAVPYEKPTDELASILKTTDMGVFAVACEALSYKTNEKAFAVLNSHTTNEDKNKRLCVLKTIFRHPLAVQAKAFLEESLLSYDILFAQNALQIVSELQTDVSDELILSAVTKHFAELYCTYLYALKNLRRSEENFSQLISFFKKAQKCGQKEVLAEILIEKYSSAQAQTLACLFAEDRFEKIRKLKDKI